MALKEGYLLSSKFKKVNQVLTPLQGEPSFTKTGPSVIFK